MSNLVYASNKLRVHENDHKNNFGVLHRKQLQVKKQRKKTCSLNIHIFLNEYLHYSGLSLALLLNVFILTFGFFLYFKLRATTGCDDSGCASGLFEVTSVNVVESFMWSLVDRSRFDVTLAFYRGKLSLSICRWMQRYAQNPGLSLCFTTC